MAATRQKTLHARPLTTSFIQLGRTRSWSERSLTAIVPRRREADRHTQEWEPETPRKPRDEAKAPQWLICADVAKAVMAECGAIADAEALVRGDGVAHSGTRVAEEGVVSRSLEAFQHSVCLSSDCSGLRRNAMKLGRLGGQLAGATWRQRRTLRRDQCRHRFNEPIRRSLAHMTRARVKRQAMAIDKVVCEVPERDSLLSVVGFAL